MDAEATVAAVEANERAAAEAETTRLLLAGHWADLHPGDAVDPNGLPGRERPLQLGGDGTPEVADFAPADLGPVLKTTAGSVRRLIGDALDLRHRLPRTWAAGRSGRVPVWQARRVAFATRHLTRQQAGEVDARLASKLGTISFGRLQTLLEAFVYDADPEGADAAAELAARDRFVRLGRSSEHGVRLMIAKMAAGDAAWGHALVTRLADILKRDGDLDSLDVRRSKAFGILLTQPAEALRLLCSHQDDDSEDGEEEPDAGEGDGGEPAALFDEQAEPDPAEPDPAEPDPAEPDPAEPDPAGTAGPGGPSTGSGREAGGPSTGPGRGLQIVPPPFDPERARPRAIVYVHLSEVALTTGRGIARVEDGGPILVGRLGQLVGERCQILLKPVIDLNDTPAPVDAYEIPDVIAEHLRLRQPSDVFPYAAGGSRRTDLDHTIAYLDPAHGGPPGQTGIGTLGPLVRYHHRVRTHGRWRIRQPESGVWLWRSPQKRIFLVNESGTHPLGHSPFAQHIWRAAKAPPAKRAVSDTVASADPVEGSGPGSRIEQALRGLLDAHTLAS